MISSLHKIIIITAPSGAGKTSITRHLLNSFPDILTFSISATTRARRSNEKEGVDYYFLTVDDFRRKIKSNSFIEWEEVYMGNYYGTLKSEIHRIWRENKIPLLDIDVKGAIHIQQGHADNCLSIFIEPPSVEELKKRLESRGTESPETLNTRINKANYEISFKDRFNKVIINKDLDTACLEAERFVKDYIGENPIG